MLKYFAVITGFATLVSALYLFLRGTEFYLSVALSSAFALATLIAWRQSDRASRLEAIIRPVLISLLENTGSEVVPLVVETAKRANMRNEVVNILIGLLRVKVNPTERYWIYIALGLIGGKDSRSAIEKGLLDENKFARLGAEEAWKSIKC
jgi:hypothetical protein